MITIAIGKGRMQESALALLARAGIHLKEGVNSRRLALMDETRQYRFIFVKPADVPVYVEHGIADCGIVGRGGRYDGLTGSFGRAEPAVGFVLNLDALTEVLGRQER